MTLPIHRSLRPSEREQLCLKLFLRLWIYVCYSVDIKMLTKHINFYMVE